MVSLFRKLDTPREREVHRFIDDNGGIKSVIESDQLLEQLASKSGDTSMSSNGNGSSGWGASARSNGSTAAKGSKFKAGKMDEKRKGGNASASAGHDLLELRKNLRKELAEDIDEMLERNLVLFERKLAIQSQRMHEVVKEESDRVITSLLAGAHDRITDLVRRFLKFFQPNMVTEITVHERTFKQYGKIWYKLALLHSHLSG